MVSVTLLAGLGLPLSSPAEEATSTPAGSARPAPEPGPGEPRRIGEIEVHEAEGWFQVPATVLRDMPPLEFLAATRAGFKAYESLLEVSATALEFNLACILLGLDSKRATRPRSHFDPEPVQGDEVDVWVSWERDGEEVHVDAARLIRKGTQTAPTGQWVYTGSGFAPDGRYLATIDGTAIGFVHDPASIIEHRVGFGLNEFGLVEPNREILPPVGTKVTLTVKRRKAPAEKMRTEPATK
jgi:hypothetical protein